MLIHKHRLTGVVLISSTLFAGAASAFNFGNMMNPGRWFNNNNDRDYDYYDYGPGGGYPGYGYPGYGYPGGAWGPGYGAPGYGMPGYQPGATTGLPAEPAKPSAAARSSSASGDDPEVERLRRRVEELEQSQRQPQNWGNDRGAGGGYQYPPSDATYDNPPSYQQYGGPTYGGYPDSGSSYGQPAGGFNAQPGFQPQGGAPTYPQGQPYGGGYQGNPSYPGTQSAPGPGYGGSSSQYRTP